jgi:hypothetical protein
VNKSNVALLFSGEHDNDHYDAVLPDEEKDELEVYDEVCFVYNLC